MKLSDRTVLSFVFRLFCLMVWISIGIMSKTKNGFKPMRGRNLPLHVDPQWSSEQFLPAAVKKQKDFNQDMEDGEYVLLYPDGSLIKKNITFYHWTIQRGHWKGISKDYSVHLYP